MAWTWAGQRLASRRNVEARHRCSVIPTGAARRDAEWRDLLGAGSTLQRPREIPPLASLGRDDRGNARPG